MKENGDCGENRKVKTNTLHNSQKNKLFQGEVCHLLYWTMLIEKIILELIVLFFPIIAGEQRLESGVLFFLSRLLQAK